MIYVCMCMHSCIWDHDATLHLIFGYGVASVSRIEKIIGLFCKRALSKRRYSAKETYHLINPTDRSHPKCVACACACVCVCVYIHMYTCVCTSVFGTSTLRCIVSACTYTHGVRMFMVYVCSKCTYVQSVRIFMVYVHSCACVCVCGCSVSDHTSYHLLSMCAWLFKWMDGWMDG